MLFFLWESLLALPFNFRRNLDHLRYHELKSPAFIIYHDHRTPNEAKLFLEALQAGKPIMENWLQVRRPHPLPVISSAVTQNASFANFITDALELQTLGRGDRDLAWHELAHATMYRTLTNWFGPAGSIIHLPWLPAWWIEGLAEAFSVSVRSDIQSAIERHYALYDTWPSYDKLHSLYGNGYFALPGYALSGSFVIYILTNYLGDKLPEFMEVFYYYSMPWWWPWTIVPFNDFLPMDAALKKFTGKNGRDLYEEYKTFAKDFWTKKSTGSSLEKLIVKNNNFSIPIQKTHTVNHHSSSMMGSRYFPPDLQKQEWQIHGKHFSQVVVKNGQLQEVTYQLPSHSHSTKTQAAQKYGSYFFRIFC